MGGLFDIPCCLSEPDNWRNNCISKKTISVEKNLQPPIKTVYAEIACDSRKKEWLNAKSPLDDTSI
jgi:hypothetical protein